MDQHHDASHSQLKPSVILLNGTAREGTAGPVIGLMDYGVSNDAFFFRVALPGIRKTESKLRFEILHDGTVNIRGVVSPASGILTGFRMIRGQLPPPGPFTVSFKLPGAVDPRLVSLDFRVDGILEGVVMKTNV